MIRCWLLDVEGTTTPLSFVTEVLFPFARERFLDYLNQNWDDPEIQGDVAGLSPERLSSPQQATIVALELMDQDRKLGALKSLQGRIWQEGYRSGQLKGQLFADVPERLKQIKQAGGSVFIYSSGSVLAQQLLFRHSEFGDLTPWIDGYFDTAVGAKVESESYRRISELTRLPAELGIFATDAVAEALAADRAGWRIAVMLRPGNQPQPRHSFPEWGQFPEPGRLGCC